MFEHDASGKVPYPTRLVSAFEAVIIQHRPKATAHDLLIGSPVIRLDFQKTAETFGLKRYWILT